jgi:hypothetical protein
MKQTNIKFIFVYPKTQSFGEVIFNDSEATSLKYEDLVKEIKKYVDDFKINSIIKEFIMNYKPFLIDIENIKIIELKAKIDEKEFKYIEKQQDIKKTINNLKKYKKNLNNIEYINEKLNSFSTEKNDWSKNFYNKMFKNKYDL